jgi:hypothetical protein
MQPIAPDLTTDKGHRSGKRLAPAQSESALSLESQIRLRALYEYVEACRETLKEINVYLSLFKTNPACSQYPKRASELLENFCIEADSWGFDALYEIGLGLQVLLLNYANRMQSSCFWEAVNRGVAMLSTLLEQCESDFRRRLLIADVLDCLKQTARN